MIYILRGPLWLLSEEWIAAQRKWEPGGIEETTAVVLALEPVVMVACTRVVAVEMENCRDS